VDADSKLEVLARLRRLSKARSDKLEQEVEVWSVKTKSSFKAKKKKLQRERQQGLTSSPPPTTSSPARGGQEAKEEKKEAESEAKLTEAKSPDEEEKRRLEDEAFEYEQAAKYRRAAEQARVRRKQLNKLFEWKQRFTQLSHKVQVCDRERQAAFRIARAEVEVDATECDRLEADLDRRRQLDKRDMLNQLEKAQWAVQRLSATVKEMGVGDAYLQSLKNQMENAKDLINTAKASQHRVFEELVHAEEVLGEELDQFTQRVQLEEEQDKAAKKQAMQARKPHSARRRVASPVSASPKAWGSPRGDGSTGSTNLQERISEIDEDIAERGGSNGGWDERDHRAFLRCVSRLKIPDSTLTFAASKNDSSAGPVQKLISRTLGEVPSKDDDGIWAHIQWYGSYLNLLKEKKNLVHEWKTQKQAARAVARRQSRRELDRGSSVAQEQDDPNAGSPSSSKARGMTRAQKAKLEQQRAEEQQARQQAIAEWKAAKEAEKRRAKLAREAEEESKRERQAQLALQRRKEREQIALYKLERDAERDRARKFSETIEREKKQSSKVVPTMSLRERQRRDLELANSRRAVLQAKGESQQDRAARIASLKIKPAVRRDFLDKLKTRHGLTEPTEAYQRKRLTPEELGQLQDRRAATNVCVAAAAVARARHGGVEAKLIAMMGDGAALHRGGRPARPRGLQLPVDVDEGLVAEIEAVMKDKCSAEFEARRLADELELAAAREERLRSENAAAVRAMQQCKVESDACQTELKEFLGRMHLELRKERRALVAFGGPGRAMPWEQEKVPVEMRQRLENERLLRIQVVQRVDACERLTALSVTFQEAQEKVSHQLATAPSLQERQLEEQVSELRAKVQAYRTELEEKVHQAECATMTQGLAMRKFREAQEAEMAQQNAAAEEKVRECVQNCKDVERELKSRIKCLKQEHATSKRDAEHQIAKLRETLHSTEGQKEMELKLQANLLESSKVAEIAKLKEAHEKYYRKERSERDARVKRAKAQLKEEYRLREEELLEKHQSELEGLNDMHEEKNQLATQTWQKKLSQIKQRAEADFQDKLAQALAEQEMQFKTQVLQMEERHSEVLQAQEGSSHHHLSERCEKLCSTLEAERAQHQKELEAERSRAQAEVEDARDACKKQVSEIRVNFIAEKQRLVSEYEEQQKQLQVDFQSSVAELQRSIETKIKQAAVKGQKDALAEVAAQTRELLEKRAQAHREELCSVKSECAAQVDAARAELASEKAAFETRAQEIRVRLEKDFELQNAKECERLAIEHDAVVRKLELALEAMTAEHEDHLQSFREESAKATELAQRQFELRIENEHQKEVSEILKARSEELAHIRQESDKRESLLRQSLERAFQGKRASMTSLLLQLKTELEEEQQHNMSSTAITTKTVQSESSSCVKSPKTQDGKVNEALGAQLQRCIERLTNAAMVVQEHDACSEVKMDEEQSADEVERKSDLVCDTEQKFRAAIWESCRTSPRSPTA
ncbi:Coiled-coil domain-containing protein 112, partial [Durusdinium trenchii]